MNKDGYRKQLKILLNHLAHELEAEGDNNCTDCGVNKALRSVCWECLWVTLGSLNIDYLVDKKDGLALNEIRLFENGFGK